MAKSPTNIDEYKEWLKKEHSIIIDTPQINYYEGAAKKIKSDFENSDFWKDLIKNFDSYELEYFSETHYILGVKYFKPKILIKPFDSALEKSFRKNILNNENFPKEPDAGWILPENFFEKMPDIIRTSLTVKYLDGVEFITKKLEELSGEYNYDFESDFEARNDGYYAVHVNIKREFDIPKIDWDSKKIEVKIEIQITTQLKDVIKKLLHSQYKEKRVTNIDDGYNWAWRYDNEEFSLNYLGHMLHYLEGMIMEIRKRGE